MSKISAYTALTSVATDDVLPIVDVHDLTMASTGTTKKITVGNLNAVTGLQYLTGGGTINTATITNAISGGFTGIYLDPRYVWHMGGTVFNGVQNFVVESRMTGSIGFSANIAYNSSGYIDTGSGADGIQVYSSSPSGSGNTQGVIFRNCAFVGSNTNAVMHFGGGQRRCRMEDCFVYNTNASAGAYALVMDTQLSNNNSENNQFTRCDFAGAYAAIGLGINNQTQNTNDTLWTDIATSGGTYGTNITGGGQHTFLNYYDRSNPSSAIINASGGNVLLIGGEDRNTNGPLYRISGGQIVVYDKLLTYSSGAPANGVACVISAGLFCYKGRNKAGGAFQISGTGVVDFSDQSMDAGGGWAVTGSAGTLAVAAAYVTNSGPNVSGWTGTTKTI